MNHRTQDMVATLKRVLILAGLFTVLLLFATDASLPRSEAKPRTHRTIPEETGQFTPLPVDPPEDEGEEGEEEPEPPTPPLNFDDDQTQGASVLIDAQDVRHPVYKGNFGGKILKALESYSYYKNLEHLKKLAPGFWTWAHTAPGSNYRWDTNQPLEGGYETVYPVYGVAASGAIPDYDKPNVVGLEFWQRTDIRHCAFVRKFADTQEARVQIIFRDEDGSTIARDDIDYVRFDFKVDSETEFRSPDEDKWCLLWVDSERWNPNYKVYILEDMRIEMVAYSRVDSDHHHRTTLAASNQFTRGEWHTVEVYYVAGSQEATAAYYLDGVRQDIVTGLDTSSSVHTGTRKINLGCCSGKDAEGKVYLDAVRAHNTYVGVDPGDPRDFICAVHFDSSASTIDDFLYYAEEAGVRPIVQTVLLPPGDERAHYTAQFSADLVEYVNGEADPDYINKSKMLDFTHRTPSDNWANLRAARGRVEPYDVTYFTMGNEPYWAEGWPKSSPELYARDCHKHALAMKEVDPSIKIGVFMYDGPNWDLKVLTQNEDVLDWVCVMHDYSYEPGVNLSDQIPRLLGISAATSLTTGKPRIHRHSSARSKLEQYLPDRQDIDEMITSQDEHGFCLIYPPGSGADLGYAIYRMGYRLETIEQGGPYAWDSDWLVINDRKYTYGVIGSDCLNPTYWAYRLFYEHFGDQYLDITTVSPEYTIYSVQTGTPLYTTPYISAYASLSESGAVMKIIVINRSPDQTIDVDFGLENFTPSTETARIYKVGGGGKGVFDNNLEDPDNIVIEESEIEIAGTEFTYPAEPLSITAIEIERYGSPVLSLAHLSGGRAELRWTSVPAAHSYILQWGDSEEVPTGGTDKYPGGKYTIRLTTRIFMDLDPGDSLFATVKARFADGSETANSNVVHLNVLNVPTNVRARLIGRALVVTCDAVPGAAGYRVHGGFDPDNPYDYAEDAGDNTIKVLYPSQEMHGTFYIVVTAYNDGGIDGPPSDVVDVELP